MKRLLVLTLLLAVTGLAAAACGGGGGGDSASGIQPIPGNSELVVGANRLALALVTNDNERVLKEGNEAVHLRLFFGEDLKDELDAGFTWAIQDVSGFWVANVDFDQAGQWTIEATLTRDGEESTVRFNFPVLEDSAFVNVGDAAPASENLTLISEPNIDRVSTDPDPDPALYQMTVAEALDAGKPFVVVFATPTFCQTQFCGQVVENVEAAREEFADEVNFIHIEPFELTDEGALVTNDQNSPIPVQAALDWQLQTEPWVFIVGADGIVKVRIENAVSVEELQAAIAGAL